MTPRKADDHHWLALAFVVLVALGARLVTLASFSDSIYGSQLMPDEQVYDFYARAVQKGEPVPAIVGFTAQVPAYVFSAAYSLLGTDSRSVRLLNVLLGSATCLCLYFAGLALKDRLTGLIAALGGALYGPFILASVTAHKTALELFLIGISLALGVRAAVQPRLVEIALFAMALGLSTHVRGNALILVFVAPVALAWVWRAQDLPRSLLPKLLAYGLGLAVVLVPLSNGGILGATEHGFNFYLANNLDNATPYYCPVRFAPAQPTFQGGGFVLHASVEQGRTLSVAEAREYYNAELRDAWTADPRAAASKVLSKLAASVNAYEHAHNHNLAFVSRFVPPLALPWISFGLLLPFAVLGMVESRRIPQRVWLICMAIGYWLTLVIFFTEIRLRAPLGLLLIPLGAIGLQSVFLRRGRELAITALVFAVSLAATQLPVPGAGDLTTANNLHALLLFDSGDYAGAERYYRASHELEGLDSESALLGLAAVAVKRDDLDAAQGFLQQISDSSYKASEKYEQLGGVLVRRHHFQEAAPAFEEALAINPGLLRTYPVLEMLYKKLGQREQLTDIQKRYRYALSFFE